MRNWTQMYIGLYKGSFAHPIREADCTLSKCLLQNIIIFLLRKMRYPNAKSDSHVNKP
jgi:hypothetical protein